jgi:hypothetical protein
VSRNEDISFTVDQDNTAELLKAQPQSYNHGSTLLMFLVAIMAAVCSTGFAPAHSFGGFGPVAAATDNSCFY